jgi:hypothetical protein
MPGHAYSTEFWRFEMGIKEILVLVVVLAVGYWLGSKGVLASVMPV